MFYFFILYGSMAAIWLIIGILGVIADAKNRAAWRGIANDCEVSYGW